MRSIVLFTALAGLSGASIAAVQQPAPAAPAAPAPVAAAQADFKVGAAVRDSGGTQVGTIASVDAAKAVVDTGDTKIGVPLTFFKKDDAGVLLTITGEQFHDAIAKAHARIEAEKAAAAAPAAAPASPATAAPASPPTPPKS